MAVLTKKCLQKTDEWKNTGIKLPAYDLIELEKKTINEPRWMHVGPGNIFRGYIAGLAQDVIEKGYMDTGITVLCTFDYQIMDKIYKPYDNLALQVIMKADGNLNKTVIASIGESIRAQTGAEDEWVRAKEVFIKPTLQMVSFTITEKGYGIKNIDSGFFPDVIKDIENGPYKAIPTNGMAIIAALLLERFEKGKAPIAIVSMDNFSHNGDKLKASICTIAEKWVEKKHITAEFLEYINDNTKVSFPWSMIDKITPRPNKEVAENLNKTGFESTDIIVTDKNTYIAPFVNAEEAQYLVIEDNFPNGRPPLEKAGVFFTDKNTVDLVERMKVCTCLNPLHTAMSIFGCLLGYTSIAAQMKDKAIVAMIKRIGYTEGMPVVVDPIILNPKDFLEEVIEKRLPNFYIPDTPQRIACDTSQKMAIRFGQTIKLYTESESLNINSLRMIPLAIAAWCRYLLGIDDSGKKMELSPDPLLNQLKEYVKDIRFGEPESTKDNLKPILSNKHIFGIDLYKVGLGGRIEDYFKKMIVGKGKVRDCLEEEILKI